MGTSVRFDDLSTSKMIKIQVNGFVLQGEGGIVLKKICLKKFEESPRNVHFDLKTVRYMDSVAIASLLVMVQVARKRKKSVFLDSLSSELKHLFRSLSLDPFFAK